jgi:hypothetical protein
MSVAVGDVVGEIFTVANETAGCGILYDVYGLVG